MTGLLASQSSVVGWLAESILHDLSAKSISRARKFKDDRSRCVGNEKQICYIECSSSPNLAVMHQIELTEEDSFLFWNWVGHCADVRV